MVRKAIAHSLNETNKAVALNLFDRLRWAETNLKAPSSPTGTPDNSAGDGRSVASVFSRIELSPLAGRPVGSLSRIRIESIRERPGIQVVLEVINPVDGHLSTAVLDNGYLWENLDSASYTFCVSGAEFSTPYCQGVRSLTLASVQNARIINFQPYFNAQPWTITAKADFDIAEFLPVRIGYLFAYITVAALLVTLSASAFFIRRMTTSIDTLMQATDAVKNGNFAHVIPLGGMKDEFMDVAESFNEMSRNIGNDIAFLKLLAEIDEAILGHHSIDQVASISLKYLSRYEQLQGLRMTLLDHVENRWSIFAIRGPNEIDCHQSGTTRLGAGSAGPQTDQTVLVAQNDTLVCWLDMSQCPSDIGKKIEDEIDICRSRVAVAMDSEAHERRLVSQALHDSLTKLFNRSGLAMRVNQAIVDAARCEGSFELVYLDLDGFKDVNDAYGHDKGDELLKSIASRIGDDLPFDTIALARLGGDEFVVVLPVESGDFARSRAAPLLETLQDVFAVGDLRIRIGASLGVAIYPADGATYEQLLKHADLAMYAAKAGGKNRIFYYDSSLDSASQEKIELRRDLSEALENGQLYLVYQPRVACSDLSIRSAEALLRWKHPSRGNIPPDVFIPLAEDSGLILEIGYWVLKESLLELRRWPSSVETVDRISVNLSPIQLMDENLIDTIESIFSQSGVSPGSIEFEVTEGALIKDMNAVVAKLTRLQTMGCGIALDDFGVGYSAMSYLSVLPFDTLKIDKSFVGSFESGKSAQAIASAIVALAKALDKQVVAEGVETLDQANALIRMGVDELQGYLYSRPIAAYELHAYIASHGR